MKNLIISFLFMFSCSEESINKVHLKNENKSEPKKLILHVKNHKMVNKLSLLSDFKTFLTKFNDDKIFQKRSVEFPLKFEVTDEFDVPNSGYTEFVMQNEWKKITISEPKCSFLDETTRLEFKVYELENIINVIIKGTETGIHISYVFEKKLDKWRLIKIIDDSI
jgi:hypothetical protein